MRPPRLRESHAHIAMHGRAMSMIPLHACRSAADLLRVVADASGDGGREWLVGVGMRTEAWEPATLPTLRELDDASRGRPCFLWSFDHHAALASSAALRAAGIEPGAPGADLPKGRIVRDGPQGRATGLLIEGAAKLVWAIVPEPTPVERREQVLAAIANLEQLGFVEVHDLHAPPWLGPLLAELHDQERLSMDVTLYPPLDQIEEAAAGARGPEGWERPGLRLGGAKLFADGTLNSRTAWMLHPYADPLPGMPYGQAMHSPEQLDAALTRVARLGLRLAVHAIGDAAVRAVLDSWERMRGTVPGAAPPRIEHAEIIDEADVARFARLGVLCSVQPCHLLADVEALRRGLPHRLSRVLPLRELIDAGCQPGVGLVFGSDVPIVRPDPEDSIQAAVHRKRPGDAACIAPEQAILEEEAWRAFTPGASNSPA
jgi:predicted amidohydrolase YtcJ